MEKRPTDWVKQKEVVAPTSWPPPPLPSREAGQDACPVVGVLPWDGCSWYWWSLSDCEFAWNWEPLGSCLRGVGSPGNRPGPRILWGAPPALQPSHLPGKGASLPQSLSPPLGLFALVQEFASHCPLSQSCYLKDNTSPLISPFTPKNTHLR